MTVKSSGAFIFPPAKIMNRNILNIPSILLLALLAISGLSGCKSAKLADADAAMARGEYFDAQKIYRKIYTISPDARTVPCAARWHSNSETATVN